MLWEPFDAATISTKANWAYRYENAISQELQALDSSALCLYKINIFENFVCNTSLVSCCNGGTVESPNLSDITSRNLVSFAAIVGGSALAYLTGGVSAAVGAVIASVFVNVATTDADKIWDRHRRQSKYSHRNHDLTRLVGSAISRALYACAESTAPKSCGKWLKDLAKVAEEKYDAIASCSSLGAIKSDRLPELFAQAAQAKNLNVCLLDERHQFEGQERSVAYGLICELRDAAGCARNDGCHVVAEQYLIRNLFSAIREMCNRAFEGQERAYGALLLDTIGACLGSLTRLGKDHDAIMKGLQLTGRQSAAFQRKIVQSIELLATQVEVVENRIMLLGEIRENSQFMPRVNAKLEDVQKALKSLQMANSEAIENSTQQILDGLNTATTQVGKLIDISSTLSRLRDMRFDKLRIAVLKTLGDLIDITKSEHVKSAASATLQWLDATDTFDQCEQILRRAFLYTVESQLRSTESRFGTRIVDYLCNIEEDQPIATVFACTLLQMDRVDKKVVPEYLWRRLEIEDVHCEFFVQYLYKLHEYLKGERGFAQVIVFANQVNALGQIKAYCEKLEQQFNRVDRTRQWLTRETRNRQLGQEFINGLDGYVRYLSEVQLPYSPLAFVAPQIGLPSEVHIKEIYVPVSLRESPDGKPTRLGTRSTAAPQGDIADGKREIISAIRDRDKAKGDAEGPPIGSIVSDSGSLVILGPPGIGKSTLMRRIALALAEASPEEIPGWTKEDTAIPVFIRLKGLAEFLHKRPGEFVDPCYGSVISYLDHFYRVQAPMELPPRFFDILLEFGGCACILDGFDEVGTLQREAIAGHLTEFIRNYGHDASRGAHTQRLGRDEQPANLFVMTSREKGYEAAAVTFRPAEFSIAQLTPLTPNGISYLLKRLLKYLDKGDEEQVSRDFTNLSREILGRAELTTLAGIPFFCTSMVLIYEHLGKRLSPQKFDILDEIVKLSLGYWDIIDNKGRTHWSDEEPEVEVNAVVGKNRKRLSYIAYNMQNREERTRIEFADVVKILADYLQEHDEGPSDDHFRRAAARFIRASHDRSNLLVETESTDTSSIYEFIHEAFREFFTADWVATSRVQEIQNLFRQHIDDPAWEQVLLLAASHTRTRASDDTCHDIIETCLDLAAESTANGDTLARAWRLSMAARITRGFVTALTNTDKKKLREKIVTAMSDMATPVPQRLDLATQLSMLGWLEGDLYEFAPIEQSGRGRVFVSRGLVANQLYDRFVNSDDYNDVKLWSTPYCTSLDGREINISQMSLEYCKSLVGNNRFPNGWNDPQFGIDNRAAPVVGVNWYEANAYCAWLFRHWNELPEARSNPAISPLRIRLPREVEWSRAVFGDLSPRTLPWSDRSSTFCIERSDVDGRANIGKLLTRTTPVGMFPQGRSLPCGLLDSLGNAWEWQANWSDYSYRGISLRGGAYSTSLEQITPNLRGVLAPGKRDLNVGFRVLVDSDSAT